MAILGKQLADGQLPNAEGDLYTCPADTRVFIKSIICAGSGESLQMSIYLRPSGGVSRTITHAALGDAEVLYFNDAIVLDAGDKIRGEAEAATTIDYTICGATESTT